VNIFKNKEYQQPGRVVQIFEVVLFFLPIPAVR
jgi:hypothetical protein